MKTIRGQILTFLLVGAAILFGLLFIFSAIKLNQLPNLIKSQYSDIVSARADEVSKELKGFKEQIVLTARSSIVKSMDLERIKVYLPEFVISDKHRNMTIGYPDGSAWSTLQDEFDISNQEQYQKIFIDKEDFVISQPFYSPFVYESHLPIVTVSHSVKADDRIIGLVNLVMNIGFLDDVIRNMNLQHDAYGWIINKDGMVVAHPDSNIPVTKNIRDYVQGGKIIEEILASGRGTVEYIDENDNRMLAFFNKIDYSPDWYFLISISQNAIYGEVNDVRNTILAAIVIGLFALVLFAVFFSKSLSKPILDLIGVFEKAAKGNLNEKANENVGNELGLAAKSFNVMLEKIKDLTYKDNVTGLYNYTGFVLELPHRIKRIKAKNLMSSIAIISIDDFKRINSVYGFSFGDQVLCHAAAQVKRYLKGEEIVARFLGDEFIVLLNEPSTIDLQKRVEGLWHLCGREVKIGINQIRMKTSIGASLFFPTNGSAEDLIHQANIAKLIVKKNGGNHYKFYDYELEDFIKEEQRLEDALYHAVEQNELKLVYQPIMELSTKKYIKAEALLRWINPNYPEISPSVFIKIAEKNGFIIDIGNWVLREACRQNVKWQQEGHPPIKTSVNVSAIQFEQTNFVKTVKSILAETGLESGYLELEITEGIALEGEKENFKKIKELRAMGISLAIDDFGTGYSSLAYFTRFPIDTLKIDRSFISNMLNDDNTKAIIKTIINLANLMKIETIAEGVETNEQLIYLYENKCDQIQGYLISEPVAAEEIAKMLRNEND